MSKPWDITPWPETGDSNPDTIYVAVGKALTHWEFVEQAVAQLFAFVSSSNSGLDVTSPSIRAYGAINSSAQRIEMVREAAKAWFHPLPECPLENACRELLNECKEWAARRNEIAHGKVDCLTDTYPNGWHLFPGLFNTKKRPLNDKAAYRYTAANIEHYANGFVDLHERIVAYLGALTTWHRRCALLDKDISP
jgi:hypothetical protein